jgi:hypothetical protein
MPNVKVPIQVLGSWKIGKPITPPFVLLDLLDPFLREPPFEVVPDGALHGRLCFEKVLVFSVFRLLNDLVHRRRAAVEVLRHDLVEAKLLPIAQIWRLAFRR